MSRGKKQKPARRAYRPSKAKRKTSRKVAKPEPPKRRPSDRNVRWVFREGPTDPNWRCVPDADTAWRFQNEGFEVHAIPYDIAPDEIDGFLNLKRTQCTSPATNNSPPPCGP